MHDKVDVGVPCSVARRLPRRQLARGLPCGSKDWEAQSGLSRPRRDAFPHGHLGLTRKNVTLSCGRASISTRVGQENS